MSRIERFVKWTIPASVVAKCMDCKHRWPIGPAEHPTECPKCVAGARPTGSEP